MWKKSNLELTPPIGVKSKRDQTFKYKNWNPKVLEENVGMKAYLTWVRKKFLNQKQ